MTVQDRILDRMEELPTLPSAVAELSALLASDRSTAADFEKIIMPDPALTANVLRLVNSAHVGLRREISSVRQAVTLLGMRKVFEMAASMAFAQVLPERIPGYDVDARTFWRHCIAVAVFSEQLARELDLEAPDLVFTAGLLHDLGKLAVGTLLLKEQEELRAQLAADDRPFVEIERRLVGGDHCEVGTALAERWRLPRAVVWAAAWHHRPGQAPDEVDQILVDLVHAADGLAHTMGFGADVGELSRTIDPEASDRLEITPAGLERVACDALEQVLEMSAMLESR